MRFVRVSVTVKEPSSEKFLVSARKPRDHGGGDRLGDPVAAAAASVAPKRAAATRKGGVENVLENAVFFFVILSKASFSFP